MAARERVIEVPELDWSFSDSKPRAQAGSRVVVDPFPAYAHDARLVRRTLRIVESAVSIPHKPTIFLLHHEPPERTNGWAQSDTDWDEATESWIPAPGWIVLAAKRIPPHPAMTRYLVAHEYGHHVQYAIQHRNGQQAHEESELLGEYAHLRGHDRDAERPYGGGTWHATTGELFANDFRILVADVEPEFWPHPGFPRPERVKGLRKWWREALA